LTYILDACALLALLKEEEGAEKIYAILKQSGAGKALLYMHIVNLLEVYYGIRHENGQELADEVLKFVDASSIKIIEDITDPIFREAGYLKSSYKCSLADAIGLGAAFDLSGTFVTSDGEIQAIDRQEPINILWFR
jgi:PIN domain nuclease of toxin-antitoxin system